MGLLINGTWHDQWYDTKSNEGKFQREAAKLRNWVTIDGVAKTEDSKGFKAQSKRYHLYVSLACPWAHRTLIMRHLKDLEPHIDVSIVSPDMLEHGWSFAADAMSTGDALYRSSFMHELYTKHSSNYSGRVTVPVLWDTHTQQIVSNESSEIIRMFNDAFNHITGNNLDFYPKPLQTEIDAINEFVYHNVNNGVYKVGFATTQAAYEAAFDALFSALDKLDTRLETQRFLVGNVLTEADIRLFTTLVRFDAVYVGHFKCNLKRIEDYANLSNYLRDIYQHRDIAKTTDIAHIKRHYYFSHTMINPTQVVPKGPELYFDRPHDRNRFFS
ncbi:Glutathione S-transferase, omega [Pseudoalteromonas luteoviolacea B = ATCC 29581]|nr:Glutathione S-transferase, omega [Pseudoalteromonas luteoviolacea B = ATCC 29581]